MERTILDNPDFQRVLATNAPVRAESAQARELEYYFPILNYEDCRACHGERPFVRGVAHFRIPVAGVYEQIAIARKTLGAVFLAIGTVIAGLLIFSVHRTIVSPILSIGIMQINPLKERVLWVGRGASRRQITVDVAFHRIMSEERVENVMVIFQDRTEIVRAQKELAAV